MDRLAGQKREISVFLYTEIINNRVLKHENGQIGWPKTRNIRVSVHGNLEISCVKHEDFTIIVFQYTDVAK